MSAFYNPISLIITICDLIQFKPACIFFNYANSVDSTRKSVGRSVGRSITLLQPEISQQLLILDCHEARTHIHGPQSMNSSDFYNPLTFHLVPPAGQSFHSSRE